MGGKDSIHFFANWAKERLDKMDTTLTSLEGKAAEVQIDAQDEASKVLAELRKDRDDFRDAIKKQAGANEAAWASVKATLETDWSAFEAEVKEYVESYGKQFELQQMTFKLQAAAQLKAWRDAADKLASATSEFANERRDEIETNVKRKKADAVAAEEKLLKLNWAGNQSWSALTRLPWRKHALSSIAPISRHGRRSSGPPDRDRRPNFGEAVARRSFLSPRSDATCVDLTQSALRRTPLAQMPRLLSGGFCDAKSSEPVDLSGKGILHRRKVAPI